MAQTLPSVSIFLDQIDWVLADRDRREVPDSVKVKIAFTQEEVFKLANSRLHRNAIKGAAMKEAAKQYGIPIRDAKAYLALE